MTCSRADGTPADSDSKCTGTKPAAVSDPVHQTSGCSYQWVQGGFGAATPACGATTQTQTVTCRRGDGVVMTGSDESLCGTRPPTSQAATDYSTCTFAWSYGAYSAPSSTCGSSTQTRIGTCTRGDGAVMGTTAPTGDTSSCVSSKGAADTTLSTYQTSSCTYLWKPGAWSVVAPACGASTRTRSFTCVRSDNQTMTDTSLCGANSQSATDTSVTDYSTCHLLVDHRPVAGHRGLRQHRHPDPLGLVRPVRRDEGRRRLELPVADARVVAADHRLFAVLLRLGVDPGHLVVDVLDDGDAA